VIPGTPSILRSKLKILLIPWICMMATHAAQTRRALDAAIFKVLDDNL
jgi:hypothetical protein